MDRPLVLVALGWATGILIAGTYRFTGIDLPLLFLLLGLVVSFWGRIRPRVRPLGVAICFVGVGSGMWAIQHLDVGDDLSHFLENGKGELLTVEGSVASASLVIPHKDYASFVVHADHVYQGSNRIPLDGRMLARWKNPTAQLFVGDRVRVRGRPSVSIGNVNPGIDSIEDFYRHRGVESSISVPYKGVLEVTPLSQGPSWSPLYWASRLRSALANQFYLHSDRSVFSFVCAVWLGDRGTMSDDEFESYVETGTVHILSVSGVHVAIIYISIVSLLELFMSPGRIRAMLTLAGVSFFVILSGASPASIRSALMIACYVAAELFEREPDAPSALGTAAILQLAANPNLMFDPGFQLSFLSVASLLLFNTHFDNLLLWIPRTIRGLVSTSFSVQLLPLPIGIRTFHVFTIVSPLANFIIVPLLTAVLWLCFLFSMIVFISPFIAEIFGHAMYPLVIGIQETAAWTRHRVDMPSPSWPAIFCYSGATLALYRVMGMRESRTFWASLLIFCLIGVVVLWKPVVPSPELVVLDVGHGSAAFIQSADGHTAVIDAGNYSKQIDYGESVVAPFVWNRGLTRLDYLIISHSDSDHIGGAAYLVKHFDVGALVLGTDSKKEEEVELVELCHQRSVPVIYVCLGDRLNLGDATLEILHPTGKWSSVAKENDDSVVARLNWEGHRILFPGDIERNGELAVIKADCAADILIAPHHASETSSSEPFLQKVNPSVVLVSSPPSGTGVGNSPIVLKRYRDHGLHVWRTDVSGGIRIVPREWGLAFEGTREERGYPLPQASASEESE